MEFIIYEQSFLGTVFFVQRLIVRAAFKYLGLKDDHELDNGRKF